MALIKQVCSVCSFPIVAVAFIIEEQEANGTKTVVRAYHICCFDKMMGRCYDRPDKRTD